MSSPTEEPERPRDRMLSFVVDRLFSLEVRAKVECKESACGTYDDDGVAACVNSEQCGEKLMLKGWRRELRVMRDFKGLLEALELQEQTKGRKR